MRPLVLIALVPLVACFGGPDEKNRGKHRPRTGTPVGSTTDTATTLSTGTPGGTTTTDTTFTTTFDCTARPQPPFTTSELFIGTEEDFSFDVSGHLVYQQGSSIMGSDETGAAAVLATGAPGDPAGLDVVSDTKLLIAGPDTGTLRLMDITTGGGDTIMSGLDRPNGVLGARNGEYFVSEMNVGRVRAWEPSTDTWYVAANNMPFANGMALSPNEDVLYVAGDDDLWAIERDPVTGEWDPSTRWSLYNEPSETVYTIDVDVCGWVYMVGYSSGAVRRVSPDGLQVENVAQLTGGWSWSGMNFGNGTSVWDVDKLYLTNRSTIMMIDVGIPGSPGPNIP